MTLHDTTPPAPTAPRTPTAFPYWENKQRPEWRRRERFVKKVLRHDLFPTDEQAQLLCDDMYVGDPVAEKYVADVFFGEIGHQRGRAMLDEALDHGIDSIPDAPESMKTLFTELETVPDWVDRDLVEQGARVWRRWGTMLYSVAGAITLEIYTEGAVAMPLSLAGGYAGDNALRRFLETCKFWIDVSEPGALFEVGSQARKTAMQVRVMHVAVRKRVGDHPEWDHEAWGLPISQTYEQMTQIGGAVAPAMSLWLLGYQTTPKEMRALIHFNRYMGHLLGVQPQWPTTTIREQLQAIAMTTAARSYDSGAAGKELIESFPAAFAPRTGQRGLKHLRAAYNFRIYSAYCALWMAPGTRKLYDMPRAFPWILIPIARLPLVTATELLRRLPGLKQLHLRTMDRHRKSWHAAQMEGRQAEFDASSSLRR
ncbi:oxygenase MpaB family protein [Aeromicrobium sp. A1-2]|uniref:oxygenase MpaB family protein n=1 Tax=Aeromicrobium sp. A1-2 TaxID=2107713 RepID=UPI0020B14807|nr:oxygenase MpaB family protein [Aeromicrobium sp. A1-2]